MLKTRSDLAWPVALLVTLLVYVRFSLARGESFSYDFANYQTYLLALQEVEWATLMEFLPLTFPYVFVPGGGAFELGFAAMTKWLLLMLSPSAVYALVAAASVGLRTFAMRRLGLEWGWLAAIQIYAITLFEANALRAGVALSITLWALLMLRDRRWAMALLGAVAAASQHMQVVLFVAPFAILLLVPQRWLRARWLPMCVLGASGLATVMATGLLGGLDVSKLDDYSGQSSGAVGLNLVSVLSTVFVAFAVWVSLGPSRLSAPPADAQGRLTDRIWVCALYAALPALALLLFGTELSAIGDRAWQFAMVILVTLSTSMCRSRTGRWLRGSMLALILAIALINTLVRYPLSNFFSPPLQYERIVPLWLVR